MTGALPELSVLDPTERSCLERYLALLVERLGRRLVEVTLFGSVARGERWPRGMPIRSDLDLLVVTEEPLSEDEAQELIDATYPLFLESGRQLGPQFLPRDQVDHPRTERAAAFLAEVRRDGVALFSRESA